MGAFHAYDIRGIYSKDFDKHTAYSVGYHLVGLLKADRVLVGRDARVSSNEIFDYLTRGITDAGADAYDMGLATTPMVYYATAKHGFNASVMITASHNSREYNGMKVSRANALPVGYNDGLNTIEGMIDGKIPTPIAKSRGRIIQFYSKDEYLNFLADYRVDYSNLSFAVDCSNGMAGLIARDVLGSECIYINEPLDGSFPNHDPNPLKVENLTELSAAVLSNGCDMGIIFDGDADRVVFVDEKGEFIPPDLMIAVLGHYFLEERGEQGAVLQDIRTSKAVGEYLAPLGGKMHTWRVGRAFAAPKLREIDGVFGGELAGHYYFRDFYYSDSAMLACLLILRVLSQFKRNGVTLSQLISRVRRYANSGEINFKLERKKEAMDAIREHFASVEQPTRMMDFDGYRLEFPDWWFNIRPSNTEPYLRFLAEARTKAMLNDKVMEVRRIIDIHQKK